MLQSERTIQKLLVGQESVEEAYTYWGLERQVGADWRDLANMRHFVLSIVFPWETIIMLLNDKVQINCIFCWVKLSQVTLFLRVHVIFSEWGYHFKDRIWWVNEVLSNYSENVRVLKYLGVTAKVNYCLIQLKLNYAVVLTQFPELHTSVVSTFVISNKMFNTICLIQHLTCYKLCLINGHLLVSFLWWLISVQWIELKIFT